jgi:hypothetical protein
MPVRNIEDKALRIQLSKLDQADVAALLTAATEAREKGLLEDAERIAREILQLDPDHGGAKALLS